MLSGPTVITLNRLDDVISNGLTQTKLGLLGTAITFLVDQLSSSVSKLELSLKVDPNGKVILTVKTFNSDGITETVAVAYDSHIAEVNAIGGEVATMGASTAYGLSLGGGYYFVVMIAIPGGTVTIGTPVPVGGGGPVGQSGH